MFSVLGGIAAPHLETP